MNLCYRLVISGPIPGATLEMLRHRFTLAAVRSDRDSTSLAGAVQDQPALRALLTLIWDTGGDVLSLETEPGHPTRTPQGEAP